MNKQTITATVIGCVIGAVLSALAMYGNTAKDEQAKIEVTVGCDINCQPVFEKAMSQKQIDLTYTLGDTWEDWK